MSGVSPADNVQSEEEILSADVTVMDPAVFSFMV